MGQWWQVGRWLLLSRTWCRLAGDQVKPGRPGQPPGLGAGEGSWESWFWVGPMRPRNGGPSWASPWTCRPGCGSMPPGQEVESVPGSPRREVMAAEPFQSLPSPEPHRGPRSSGPSLSPKSCRGDHQHSLPAPPGHQPACLPPLPQGTPFWAPGERQRRVAPVP